MPKQLRIDELGRETWFILPDEQLPESVRSDFEAILYEDVDGFTLSRGIGGWKGSTEKVLIYRVASLAPSRISGLARFLLDSTTMKDIYIVLPGGHARGYSYEDVPAGQLAPIGYSIHTRNNRAAALRGLPPKDSMPLHGVRRTGWPETKDGGFVNTYTKLKEGRAKMKAYDDRLNEQQRTPTGDDYNTLLGLADLF
jgi:hypothetical protein